VKIPPLHEIAPGNPPAGPVFAVVQGIVLLFFAYMIFRVWRGFRPARPRAFPEPSPTRR
jgi:hypothetical protein